MEIEGLGEMSREIRPVVAAWINVEFVRNAAGVEDRIERRGSRFETEIIL